MKTPRHVQEWTINLQQGDKCKKPPTSESSSRDQPKKKIPQWRLKFASVFHEFCCCKQIQTDWKVYLLPTQTLKIRLQNFTVEPLNSSEFGPWMCSVEDLNVCQIRTVSMAAVNIPTFDRWSGLTPKEYLSRLPQSSIHFTLLSTQEKLGLYLLGQQKVKQKIRTKKKSSFKNSGLRLLLLKFLSPNGVQSCLLLHRIHNAKMRIWLGIYTHFPQ